MLITADIALNVEAKLTSIYEEIMWLAQRPNISPSGARAWYTHTAYLSVRQDIRRFTGKVSSQAAANDASELRLEHFKRIQTTLTQLVTRHLETGVLNCAEFINTVIDCEQVHIVTSLENYAARKAKGDYVLAGINLLDWNTLSTERRMVLWRKVLKGKVSNANDFISNA